MLELLYKKMIHEKHHCSLGSCREMFQKGYKEMKGKNRIFLIFSFKIMRLKIVVLFVNNLSASDDSVILAWHSSYLDIYTHMEEKIISNRLKVKITFKIYLIISSNYMVNHIRLNLYLPCDLQYNVKTTANEILNQW